MKVKRFIVGSVVAGSLGLAALGVGAGVASADPWVPGYGHDRGGDFRGRPGIDDRDRPAFERARLDHRPFEYQGRWVTPVFDAGYRAWGFWLGPIWIPL